LKGLSATGAIAADNPQPSRDSSSRKAIKAKRLAA
jgi:hypothetical protein